MLKYEGLDDIDTEAQEVYETSDVEDTWEIQESTQTRRDSISEEVIDSEKSRLRFEKEKVWVNAHVTDFSDRVDSVAGYGTAAVKETTQNKLNRLRLELQELQEEISTEGALEEEKELKNLQDLLSQINMNTKSKRLVPSAEIIAVAREGATAPGKEEDSITGQTVVVSPEEVVILDKRLTQLEKLLGSDFQSDTSLQSTINDLFRKFKLLSNDKDQLSNISHAIDEVNTKFEKSIAMRRAVDLEADIPEETQIHEVYTMLQRTKGVQSDLPLIIKRLQTLADLHTRVASSVNSVENIDSQLSVMEADIKSWEESLIKLETKVEEMNDTFEKNKAIILEKIGK